MAKVSWTAESEPHDYPAAAAYLSLLLGDATVVDQLVAALRLAEPTHHQAKDLLRAAGLRLLPVRNPHVASDLRKIRRRKQLSPVLLVRGSLTQGFPLQIADGYHRICASYHTDEDTDIPCRLVDLPVGAAVPGKPAAAASRRSSPANRNG